MSLAVDDVTTVTRPAREAVIGLAVGEDLQIGAVRRRARQGIRYKSLTACGMESWYRYGDSNPGPVAEKRSRRPRRSPVASVFLGFSH